MLPSNAEVSPARLNGLFERLLPSTGLKGLTRIENFVVPMQQLVIQTTLYVGSEPTNWGMACATC